jgi:hypothetical protein
VKAAAIAPLASRISMGRVRPGRLSRAVSFRVQEQGVNGAPEAKQNGRRDQQALVVAVDEGGDEHASPEPQAEAPEIANPRLGSPSHEGPETTAKTSQPGPAPREAPPQERALSPPPSWLSPLAACAVLRRTGAGR